MNLKDIYSLWLFVLVVREKTFTRAAAVAHMTQPPLSNHIRLLEERLGVKLFERTTQKVTLTLEGQLLYPRAEKFFETAKQFFEDVEGLSKRREKRYIIGSFGWMLSSFVLPLVTELQEEHDQIRYELRKLNSNDASSLVKDSEIDISYAYSEPLMRSSIESKPVAKIKLAVAIRESDPLSSRTSLSLEDMKNYKCVCISSEISSGLYQFNSLLASKYSYEIYSGSRITDFFDQAIEARIRSSSFALLSPVVAKYLPKEVKLIPLKEDISLTLIRLRRKELSEDFIKELKEKEKKFLSRLAGITYLSDENLSN